ncbi:MAG: hypothetical protein ACYC46_05615 [Acidobacteriaceae bacterium]
MENAKKISLAFTAILLVAVSIRVYLIHQEREQAEHPAAQQQPEVRVSDDDSVFLRKLYPASIQDVKALDGKSVWVMAAGQLDYFPYAAHHIDYAHNLGVLLGAEQLNVKDVVQQVKPKSVATRIPGGDRQVSLVFTRNGSDKEYAVPVGYYADGGYTFLLDNVFFYDDPHQLYKFWPKDVWDAIDRHEAKPGMSEHEVGLALGQVSTSDSNDIGNRSVEYYNGGKKMDVTFVNDKATEVKPE